MDLDASDSDLDFPTWTGFTSLQNMDTVSTPGGVGPDSEMVGSSKSESGPSSKSSSMEDTSQISEDFTASVDEDPRDMDGSKEAHNWNAFDEAAEQEAQISEEEMQRTLEELLYAEDYEEWWKRRTAKLSPEDIHNIKAFKLKMLSNMPRTAFNQMRWAFKKDMQINSLYVITCRLAVLSRVEPVWRDCCINSCLAYTGKYEGRDKCPICSEQRYTANHKPRRMFCYLPLIPRFKNLFLNEEIISLLSYRNDYVQDNLTISDVFDSEHYQALRNSKVMVDGKELEHKYFSGKHDIAFSICLDGYLLYKRHRAGPSATPMLVQIYNYPPEIRTHLEKEMSCGAIPGPRSPKLPGSYLYDFEEERVKLAYGVKTFDCISKQYFDLHGYCIFELGDIIAIEKLLNIKGHNGKSPCRSCTIKAINNPHSSDKTYYVPLANQDPLAIPLRQHDDWQKISDEIYRAKFKKNKEAIAMKSGIKGMPALTRVGSINFARGLPWDCMHLLFENVVKNLVYLWMGKFKGLDSGKEDYIIPGHIWKQIGEETVQAVLNIPSAFVRSLKNIADSPGSYTAEGWAFWFMYIAPILLKGRFQKEAYYKHFIALVDIMKTCIQYTISHFEVDAVEKNIVKWVQEYERIYYQGDPERLSTCTLTIHGLLHVCDNIRFCGPVWTTWTFWMERYCGYLQQGLKSRRHPWANLNKKIMHVAYLEQIEIIYNATEDLNIHKDTKRFETIVEGYPLSNLRNPKKRDFQLSPILKTRIAQHLHTVIDDRSITAISKKLPSRMTAWGRVRVGNGGDSMRAYHFYEHQENLRSMSYVRYASITFEGQDFRRNVHYGRLDLILQFIVPEEGFWKEELRGKTQLFAVITPCATRGDATKGVVLYDKVTTQIVVDLNTVENVIGRVPSRNKWGIVDRSGDFARTEFISAHALDQTRDHWGDDDNNSDDSDDSDN